MWEVNQVRLVARSSVHQRERRVCVSVRREGRGFGRYVPVRGGAFALLDFAGTTFAWAFGFVFLLIFLYFFFNIPVWFLTYDVIIYTKFIKLRGGRMLLTN